MAYPQPCQSIHKSSSTGENSRDRSENSGLSCGHGTQPPMIGIVKTAIRADLFPQDPIFSQSENEAKLMHWCCLSSAKENGKEVSDS